MFNLKADEAVHICQGCIFDVAAEELRKVYGEDRVKRVRVVGEAQRLVEIAYLDEIRNLGYEPLAQTGRKKRQKLLSYDALVKRQTRNATLRKNRMATP